MALLVGVLAIAIALAAAPVTAWLRGAMQHPTRVGGALPVATGAYVSYYGVYELRVNGGGEAADPVIEAAARVQQAMSTWVGSVGVLPIVLVLIVVVRAAAGGPGWRRTLSRGQHDKTQQHS